MFLKAYYSRSEVAWVVRKMKKPLNPIFLFLNNLYLEVPLHAEDVPSRYNITTWGKTALKAFKGKIKKGNFLAFDKLLKYFYY